MSPASVPDSRPVRNTNAASASEASAAGRFIVGSAIRSHSAATDASSWPWAREPLSEGAPFEGRVARVEPRQRERGPRRGESLGESQARVAEQGAREVQRRVQRVAPDAGGRAAGCEHGDVAVAPGLRQMLAAEALEQRAR